MPTFHVIGAGVSGLACATRIASRGLDVKLYEAAGWAGGRARSFYDKHLDCIIDNGTHLLLGANSFTFTYLRALGAEDKILELGPACFSFFDIKNTEQWSIMPNSSAFPSWIFSTNKRVPNTRWLDYVRDGWALAFAENKASVAQVLKLETPLYEKLWQPFCRAVLNTDATEASPKLLWSVIKNTFLNGEKSCRPWVFHKGLSAALVTPAIDYLIENNSEVLFRTRLKTIEHGKKYVTRLNFNDFSLSIPRKDIVILALPPRASNMIWPSGNGPKHERGIVNAHFKLKNKINLPQNQQFVGLIGGYTEWVFVRGNLISATISAGSSLINLNNSEISRIIWAEIKNTFGIRQRTFPKTRVIKERRATFAQTPAQTLLRTESETSLKNLFLAGDWTNTGLPATIEGAIMSGFKAANHGIALQKNQK